MKIADGAYFVPSYSEQTITPAFSTGTTLQGFGGAKSSPFPNPEGDLEGYPIEYPDDLTG
jgi:hypothetical protein